MVYTDVNVDGYVDANVSVDVNLHHVDRGRCIVIHPSPPPCPLADVAGLRDPLPEPALPGEGVRPARQDRGAPVPTAVLRSPALPDPVSHNTVLLELDRLTSLFGNYVDVLLTGKN